ncbi:MAG: spore coat protein CotJB [Hungatella sp.]|nr:spore coat protein CotJB [Hungatella sp.]
MSDRNALLKEINEVSFFLDDLRLYLDTHPVDANALNLYQEKHEKRLQLLKQYAQDFEPLTCHCINLDSNGSSATDTRYPGQKHWNWSDGPIPWDTAANNSSLLKDQGGV